jgi:hypothetical protein
LTKIEEKIILLKKKKKRKRSRAYGRPRSHLPSSDRLYFDRPRHRREEGRSAGGFADPIFKKMAYKEAVLWIRFDVERSSVVDPIVKEMS